MTGISEDSCPPLCVLHVIPTLGMGGASRLVLDLVRLLQTRENVDARLCVLGGADSFFPLDGLSAPPIFLDYSGRYRRPIETRRCVRRLRSIVEEIHSDIVHSHLWLADQISGWALTGKPGIKHVVQILDTRPWLASARPTSWFRRMLFTHYTRRAAFIASSKVARDYTCRHLGLPIDCMPVIYNGIDLQDFPSSPRKPSPKGEIIIGAAGRFEPEKGHEILIRTVADLLSKGCSTRLRLAGSGSLESRYVQVASELGIADRVELAGCVKDIAGFYREMDVFVMPSLFAEGLPLALLGAMAMGRPVVSTTGTAGAAEVIRAGVDGLLVPAGDVRAMSAAIQQLAREPGMRQRMGEQARMRVQEAFTVQEMAHKVASYYQRIIARF